MKINDIYDVVIESVDDIGNGSTRMNNIVVFVPYSLSNEKVKIKIIKLRNSGKRNLIHDILYKINSPKLTLVLGLLLKL